MLIKEETILEIIKILRRVYPENKTALRHKTVFELLCSVILSAQCTDARVNMVTPALFASYPTPEKMAAARLESVEKIIKSTGFYHAKAKSLVLMSRTLVQNFNGQVPDNMKDLLTLRGVARKTANVVLADWFNKAEGVVVDTHVRRVSFRTGLTKETDPVKIEKDLMKKIPKKDWIWLGNAYVWHGRRVCAAHKPKCSICQINKICPKNQVTVSA